MKFLSVLVLSLLNFIALGWWDNGHMLTSQIAKHYLKVINPKVYDRAEQIVLAMNGLDYEKDNQFVTAAVWPDDIKDKAMNFWDQWHFYDRPINPQGNYIIQDLSGKDMNAHDLMERALLEFEKAEEDITMQQAIFMRYVLHVVGDIHQPLHSDTMFNDTYPYPVGDMGGNLEKIIDPTGVEMNLHAFWDQGAEYFQKIDENRFERPLNNKQIVELEEWGYQLMGQFPTTYYDGQEKNMNFKEWTKESWKAAKDFAYPLTYTTNQLTEEYMLQGQQICKERVTLAGYRLAHFLEKLLKPYFDNIEKKKLKSGEKRHVDFHDGMKQEFMGRQNNEEYNQERERIRSFLGKN